MAKSTVRFGCPVDLLAGVPLLLGFVPEESVVVVSLRGGRGVVGVSVRVDLPRQQDAAEVFSEVFGHVVGDGATSVVAVVYSGDPEPAVRAEVTAAVAVLRAVGAEQGAPVDAVWHVGPATYRRLHGPGPGPCEGSVDELKNSRAAAELMLTGRSAAPSRDNLGADLGRVESGGAMEVAAAVAQALRLPAAQRADRAFMVWTLEAARAQVPGPRTEIATEPAALMLAGLMTPAVRDAVLVACVPGQDSVAAAMVAGDVDAGSEVLTRYVFGGESVAPDSDVTGAAMSVLRSLVRQAPPEVRADPLGLLGFLAWWRGEWPLAGECAQRALAADPAHRLAGLVLAAMGGGLKPGWMAARRDAHPAPAQG